MGFWNFVGRVISGAISMIEAEAEKNEKIYESTLNKYENKVNNYASTHRDKEAQIKVNEARKKIAEAREMGYSGFLVSKNNSEDTNKMSSGHRRTDDELSKDMSGLDKKPRDFEYCRNVRLCDAVNSASSNTGVYILIINGCVMKCGRAAYGQGIKWRFRQYYNLNYDDRARRGDYWSVSEQNRDEIIVSWQCCPVSVCKELEYKLFKKYGKGPWGLRAPASCNTNLWELLI